MATLQAAIGYHVMDRVESDPIAYTLLLAATLHIALILGIGFIPEDKEPVDKRRQSLNIVLVNPREPERPKPEEQDLLAQTSNQGSGETDMTAPADRPIDKATAQKESAPATVETMALPLPALPETRQEPVLTPKPVTPTSPPPIPPTVLATPTSTSPHDIRPHPTVKPKPKPVTKPKPKPSPPAAEPPKRRISAAQLLASRSDEIARLTSELERKSAAYAKRTKRKAISASTTEYKYATYMEAWRRKVERIGNLNYPDEAQRKKLYGNLLLHVAIRADGSVERVRILKSSGHKLLDDAAARIVRMAAPYSPFPPDIHRHVDVLDITRTWRFLNSNRLGWK